MRNSNRSKQDASPETRQKRAYSPPKLVAWGTVVDLTKALGMTQITDVERTGSMVKK